MTQDEIIHMAREAGFIPNGQAERAWLERFAALVAAYEREACAKVCDDIAKCCFVENPARKVVESIAAAIRARGSHE